MYIIQYVLVHNPEFFQIPPRHWLFLFSHFDFFLVWLNVITLGNLFSWSSSSRHLRVNGVLCSNIKRYFNEANSFDSSSFQVLKKNSVCNYIWEVNLSDGVANCGLSEPLKCQLTIEYSKVKSEETRVLLLPAATQSGRMFSANFEFKDVQVSVSNIVGSKHWTFWDSGDLFRRSQVCKI